jgi:hypothetical protein
VLLIHRARATRITWTLGEMTYTGEEGTLILCPLEQKGQCSARELNDGSFRIKPPAYRCQPGTVPTLCSAWAEAPSWSAHLMSMAQGSFVASLGGTSAVVNVKEALIRRNLWGSGLLESAGSASVNLPKPSIWSERQRDPCPMPLRQLALMRGSFSSAVSSEQPHFTFDHGFNKFQI